MGISYKQHESQVNSSLTEQINSQSNYVGLLKQSWQDAKKTNDTFQQQIIESQINTEQSKLQNLANSLAEQTSTVQGMTKEQKEAWINLANQSYEAYQIALDKVPEATQKEIESATGVVSRSRIANELGSQAEQGNMLFSENLKIPETINQRLGEASNQLITTNTVKRGAERLADSANVGFNNNVDGKKWGTDLSDNISSGMTSNASRSKLSSAASTVAGIIGAFLKHSVPKMGPLKDELTYMPDMIDNLVMGIDKNRYKVAKAANNVAKDIKRNFELDRLNNDIIYEMNRAISMETGSINAKASVKSNNSMLNVIQATFSIDGSVDIDGRKAGRILAPEVCRTIKVGGLA